MRLATFVARAYSQRMKLEHGIFEDGDDEATAASIARGVADVAAGRIVPNDVVIQWLRTWGTPERGPCPREWRK